MSEESKITNPLTDEEISQASGGAGFKKCPLGHYEATGFANIAQPCNDCYSNRCGKCIITELGSGTEKSQDYYGVVSTVKYWEYKFNCTYFSRIVKIKLHVPLRI